MRIAVIGIRGIPSNYSGVEKAAEQLATLAVLAGHEVTAYCMAGPKKGNKTTYKGIRRVEIFTVHSKRLEMIVYSWLALWHALRSGVDLIHFHALGSGILVPICKICGIKTVLTCHGLDYQREKWGVFARAYIKLGEMCAAKWADELIVVSKSLIVHFRSKFGREAVYIPNGALAPVQVDTFGLGVRYGLERRRYILFLGRIVECKRVNDLIRAFRLADLPVKLAIAGTGPPNILSEMHKLAENNDRIVFVGHVAGRDLEELLSNALCFALPSVLEGLPIALIEAMAYDLRVVVSDLPENLEVVSDGDTYRAFVSRQRDVVSLTYALQQCVRTALEDKLSPGNSGFVLSKYSWRSAADATLSIYESLAGITSLRVS